MAPESEVVAVGAIERDRQRTARKLDARNRAGSYGLSARTCVEGQELKSMTLGECFEVSAGVGHAVHFVETIRKKRDSQSVTIAVSQNYRVTISPYAWLRESQT